MKVNIELIFMILDMNYTFFSMQLHTEKYGKHFYNVYHAHPFLV